jgi:hypothetical protein
MKGHIMELNDIVAEQIKTDDWFFLAGELFRVGAVNTYINGTVGIQFYNPNQGGPARLTLGNLTVANKQPMQVLNQ